MSFDQVMDGLNNELVAVRERLTAEQNKTKQLEKELAITNKQCRNLRRHNHRLHEAYCALERKERANRIKANLAWFVLMFSFTVSAASYFLK